jgi:hypothetical protein
MKTKKLFVGFRPMLFVSIVLLTVGMATAQKKAIVAAYGDVIAKAGESEVVVENTLAFQLNVFVDGKVLGTAKTKGATRFVIPDGNHQIRVQATSRQGGVSKDVQFYARAKRIVFKVTAPVVNSVYLAMDNAYDLSVPPAPPAGVAAETGDAPLSESNLGKDKASMFDRLDKATAKPAPTQAPTPAASAPKAAAPKFRAPADGKLPHIAVYVTGDKNDGEKRALGTKILVALVNSGKFLAIERSDDFLSEVENEHKKQREGSVDDRQISALGKQFGVHYVCVSNITAAFGSYQVSARIINVETAVVVAVGEDDSPLRNMDDLSEVSLRVVKAMLREE